jgi:hypothetical protein
MVTLTGPYAALALLVAVAGVVKARRPASTVGALRSAGLRATSSLVRVGAVAEILLAAAAIIRGGRVPAALLAASFIGFFAFVVVGLRRGGVVDSCGCFGAADTPPTAGHLVVTAAAAVVALVVAVKPGPAPLGVLAGSPGAGVPLAVLIGLVTWLGYLTLTDLAKVSAAIGPTSRRSESGAG